MIIIIIFVLLIFCIVLGFTLINRKSKPTFYKCPNKPNSILLNEVLTKNAFKKTDQNFDMYMPCGYNNIENELQELNVNSKYIFGLKGCDKIVAKNNLWKILEGAYGRFGASKIMPETYILNNADQFRMAYDKIRKNETLICKKNLQRKLGIKFAFNENDLVECKNEDFKIAQKFMKNSMTIKNRKINLRIYYVIKKIGNKVQFFINANGKVLYTKDKTSNNISFESHITSYQMDGALYKIESLPHDFIQLRKFMGKKQFNILWKKIIEKMKYLSNAISYVFKDNQYFDKICFQLFGVDIIVENGEPYILEINKGPDMIPKCMEDIKLKENIYEQTFRIGGVIKRPFKKNNFSKIFYIKLDDTTI